MNDNLLMLLNLFRPLKILRVLSLFEDGLHVRELAAYANLSPSSVSDTLKLLDGHGLITRIERGNKVCVICKLNDSERAILALLDEQERKNTYKASSIALSKKAIDYLRWNAEMLETIRKAKINAPARIA